MWMASEMILSSEWKTSELRQVAIALSAARVDDQRARSQAGTHDGRDRSNSRSETAECEAETRLEEHGAAGEDPELQQAQHQHLFTPRRGSEKQRT